LNLTLDTVYQQLGFEDGELIRIADWQQKRVLLPENEALSLEKWVDACIKINARDHDKGLEIDAIYFIQQNPIVVFARVPNLESDANRLAVRTIWNLARPRYLFLNSQTETEVYDLGSNFDLVSPKPYAKDLADLLKMNREVIQAGYDLLNQKKKRQNAEFTLINDLKDLRSILTGMAKSAPEIPKLTNKEAHTLIAQVIFIRYLEDRAILDEAYFRERVAGTNKQWQRILDNAPDKSNLLNPDIAERFFPRVLDDREFTVALFRQLADDFNGDVFSEDRVYAFVRAEHLTLIQRFLWANMGSQQKLFLWAYQFDVIPLELISSIYEEFYHKANDAENTKDENGTHYTPSVLVEFLLARVLTVKRLKTNPRVLDPACGSGIFLVESFRRIVRYKKIFEGFEPDFNTLKGIIGQQIRGIEINSEAARVTAFSLYISLLDFLDPPHIRYYIDKKGGKLPYLLYNQRQTEKHLNVILAENAFWVENLFTKDTGLHDFQPNTVDIIVGNPPWGSAKISDSEDKKAIDWCKANGFPISDNEWSQMFVWRSLKFLKPEGEAALLVSSGTLMKSSNSSVEFKRAWATRVTLLEVFNFVLTRQVFFGKAISPFLGVIFSNNKPSIQHKIKYWTFRRTRLVEESQVVVLDKTDFKIIRQSECQIPEIWKICQFGNELDISLLSGIRLFDGLERLEKSIGRRQGFIAGGIKAKKVKHLLPNGIKEIPTDIINDQSRYSPIDFEAQGILAPSMVTRPSKNENFEGGRIIFKRGISSEGENAGIVLARYETSAFAFRDSINCFKLKEENDSVYKLVLGIIWSSLARYYYFMTVAQWGIWHDEIKPTEMMSLPIPDFDETNKDTCAKIIEIVDNLRQGPIDISSWEKQLNEHVFKLYYLTEAEKDLIRDRSEYEIDAYYKGFESNAFMPVAGLKTHMSGFKENLNLNKEISSGIEEYLDAFYQTIQPLLKRGTDIRHTIVRSKGLDHSDNTWTDAIAALFFINPQADFEELSNELTDWASVARFIISNHNQIEISQSIFIEHFLRLVSEKHLIIVKRNERRLWSRTAAREDANALFAQSLSLPQKELTTNG
jgi:type I restriction-modification system DNA methylase subunit